MKRILLITSSRTGSGHRSISDSLMEQFSGMSGLEVQVIEGFDLPGRTGLFLSWLYGFMTRWIPAVYNAAWEFTVVHPARLTVTTRLCTRRFLECVRRYHPDLILTVHSGFNIILTRILKKNALDIPVVVLQADLVDIHSTWCNPDAYMTICPTREAYDASMRQGLSPEKLRIMGFPVRNRFIEAARNAGAKAYDPSRPLHILLMSGGEGAGRMKAYAGTLLRNTDAAVTVICGRNKKLYGRLQKSLVRQYGERVNVLGFVSDVEQEMLRSDLLITRGSPNTLVEAITLSLPVIMTGPWLGQEKNNPRLMQEHHLGVICRSPADAPQIIRGLLENSAARLGEISDAQRACRSFDIARNIAAYVADLAGQLPEK